MPVAQTDMAVLCTFNSSSTATASSEPYIYCIGGTQGYDTSKLNLKPQNARYSIIENKWEELPQIDDKEIKLFKERLSY